MMGILLWLGGVYVTLVVILVIGVSFAALVVVSIALLDALTVWLLCKRKDRQ